MAEVTGQKEKLLQQEVRHLQLEETDYDVRRVLTEPVSDAEQKTGKKKKSSRKMLEENIGEEVSREKLSVSDLSGGDADAAEEQSEEAKLAKRRLTVAVNKTAPNLLALKKEGMKKEAVRESVNAEQERMKQDTRVLMVDDFMNMLDKAFQPSIQYFSVETRGRSESFKELKRAIEEVHACSSILRDPAGFTKTQALERCYRAIARVSEAADGYYDTHRGYVHTTSGKRIKQTALEIKAACSQFFDQMAGRQSEKILKDDTGMEEKAAEVKVEAAKITGTKWYKFKHLMDSKEVRKLYRKRQEDIAWGKLNPGGVTPMSKMDELLGVYEKWAKHISLDAGVATLEEQLEERLNIFGAYKIYIAQYRQLYKGETMPANMTKLLSEYDALRRKKYVLGMLKKEKSWEKTEQDTIGDVIRQHADEQDDRTRRLPLTAEEVDQGLTKEQLAGIEQIDQWLIRNFENGGMLRFVSRLRNAHGNFVSAILKKTRRERLMMYYLVQTRARKDAEHLDIHVGKAQATFVPNLDAFKNQMLSTKWNVIGHLTGSYVYMNKLSEAFNMTMQRQDEIKATGYVLGGAAKEARRERTEEEKNDPAVKRMDALTDFYEGITTYYRYLQQMEKAGKDERAGMESQAKQMADALKIKAKDMARLDRELGQVKEQEVVTKEVTFKEQVASHGGLATTIARQAAGKMSMAMCYSNKFLGWSWGLDKVQWDQLEFWTNDISAGIAVAGNVMNTVLSLHTIMTSGRSISKADFAEEVLNILKYGADSALAVATALHHMNNAADFTNAIIGTAETGMEASKEVTKATPVMKGLSVAGVVINGAIATTRWAGYGKQIGQVHKAEDYFAKKFAEKKHSENPEEERKLRRQEKFETGMVKLSRHLSERNRQNAAMSTVSTAIGVASLVIPGIGATIAAVVGGVFSVVTSILDAWRKGKIATATFDHYFSMDDVVEKVFAIRKKENSFLDGDSKENMKVRLRSRVAAAAGFSDMYAAQTHIAHKYADYIYDKLFGEKKAEGEDRDGYITLIKAMGMSYNEKKKRPEKKIIFKKMVAK